MGGTMAEALLDHGYKVCGFDIDAKAKHRFKKYGGQFLTHASDVAARADIVIVSVATAKALEQVTQAIVDGQHKRKTKTSPIVIETSTLTMADKNLCAKSLKSVGIAALDCPISGTAVRIQDRAWTIFASGPKAAYKKALPVLEIFTDNVPYVGVFGNGTKLKFSALHRQRALCRCFWQWHQIEVLCQPLGCHLQRGLCRIGRSGPQDGGGPPRGAQTVWQQSRAGHGCHALAHGHDGGT